MTNSQNGWPVATQAQQDDTAMAGVTFPRGVLKGDVATVLHYVAGRFHREVEPLHAGHCWGWYVRPIRGATSVSNHSSGTAIDLNAPAHPLGAVGTFTAAQRKAIEKILDDCDGVVRWGGHYSSRKDEMHFEINVGAAAVKALAGRIRQPAGRKLTMESLAGYTLPILKQGDSDAALDGYDRIGRVQRLLGVEADGDYGPKTTAAVKALGLNDGHTIDLPVWTKLYGLSKAA